MTVNMHDAKTNLSKLVDAAENGETIIIARNGEPAAMLISATAASKNPGWSTTMQDWFEHGEALELEIDRTDLWAAPDLDL